MAILRILGRDGADRCVRPDCSTPNCAETSHAGREVCLRIVTRHADVIDGSALLCQDAANGGWRPMGTSIDCWLSPQIIEVIDRRPEWRETIISEATDWRIRSVDLEEA